MSSVESRAAGVRAGLSARERRLEQSLVQDLAEVLPRNRSHPTLAPEQARGGIAAGRGTSQRNFQGGSSPGTGGIAGPLTEEDFSAREYYEPMLSSDGLFAIPQIKKMVLKDADGLEVVVELADPAAPAGGEP
tara:strand:- start:263 stop:661 length:399 start_codon:yes stop_codon:yes gene_type:complete